ncbi:MAG: hypothetical protein J5737_01425 [Bacteroidales bacterium]|nr:hypothetical protein [Bacteroidales bacterium]
MSGYHSLRGIKKDIDYILSAFIEDCSLVSAVNSKVSGEKASALLDKAIDLYNELRDKAAHAEGSSRAYYTALRKELLEKTDALYEELSAAVKKA